METFMAAPIPLIILDDDDDDEIQITGTTVRHSASACTAQTSISQDPKEAAGNDGLGQHAGKINSRTGVGVSLAADKNSVEQAIHDFLHLVPLPLRLTPSTGECRTAVTKPETAPEPPQPSRKPLPCNQRQGEFIAEKAQHANNTPIDPFTSKFFFDMANTISLVFPFQKFAEEHRCTVGEVDQALVAAVISPLMDGSKNRGPKTAEKNWSIVRKWKERYQKIVQQLHKESSEQRLPMGFEQFSVAASGNAESYWKARNSGLAAYEEFHQDKENQQSTLQQTQGKGVELTAGAEPKSRKRERSQTGRDENGRNIRGPPPLSNPLLMLPYSQKRAKTGQCANWVTSSLGNGIQTDSSAFMKSGWPLATSALSLETGNSRRETPQNRHARRHVTVDMFGNYQDITSLTAETEPRTFSDLDSSDYEDEFLCTDVRGRGNGWAGSIQETFNTHHLP